jgi:hypothetical protein
MKDGAPSMDVKTAVALSRLAIAWNAIAERARILRGRPLPGSFRPKPPKPKSRSLLAMPLDDLEPPVPEPLNEPPPPSPSPSVVAEPAPVVVVAAKPPESTAATKCKPDHVAASAAAVVKPANRVPCPVCHGTREVTVSGGNRVTCRVCHGTGERLDAAGRA